MADLVHEQQKINAAFKQNANFRFHAKQMTNSQNKQVYVLVIGETGRRANWQLNGYTRATNPNLSQQTNLVNLSNMLSIANATRSSIPMMLTRKPVEQVYQFAFPEKSVISAFKEAGFKTYWLSNQQQFGKFDTTTSVYAKEADTTVFLNKANYTDAGGHDDVLISALSKVLQKPDSKQFIVIHTLGSHYNYKHRYPDNFNHFRPSLNDVEKYSLQDKKYKSELINSYDNSILFTDFVLNGFIEKLKQQNNTASFLIYSADHGEDLFDHGCDKSGHGADTPYNFEIAAFAWYSDSFASQHPKKVQALLKNKDRKINQTSLFPSLIDAADITIPNYEHHKSILGNLYNYPRLIKSNINFDTAKQEGLCKEIK